MMNETKGKWVWLVCSNEKNFRKEFETEDRVFELCTKLAHFQNWIDSAHDSCEFLTITGIDNIVADLSAGVFDSGKLETSLKEFFLSLEALRQKGMKITVGPLLPWKQHSQEIRRSAVNILKNMKSMFPGIVHIPRPNSLKFTKDNVHLVERAAATHFKAVFSASYSTFFSKEDEYLTEDESQMGENEVEITTPQVLRNRTESIDSSDDGRDDPFVPSGSTAPIKIKQTTKHSIHNPEFKLLMNRIEELRRQVNARWTIDLIVSAGTKEDLDKIENNLNMNKVVIMGLDVPELWEHEDWKIRIATMKDAIVELFGFIQPGVEYKIGFIKHLNSKLKAARQIVEVTLESERNGKSIRRAYAEKIKEWKEKKQFPDRMNGVTITPALTLATRVRIAMLKVIAKVMVDEFENTDAWVIQHIARPVLKIEQTDKDNKKILTSYGFAQAIAYTLEKMPFVKFTDQMLFTSYTIAGTKFGPEISHYFVILEHETAARISKEKRQKRPKKK